MAVLHVENLSTVLASELGWVHAVDAFSLTIAKGQTFALVGESGCGKSMAALSLARLLPDCGAVVCGQVWLETNPGFAPVDTLQLPEVAMQAVRGKTVSMIFQEPGTSLNPVLSVGEQLREVLLTHGICQSQAEAQTLAAQWLQRVGLDKPFERLRQYPFQLSGGQKQRIMIAMALAAKPQLLIADEPTTALDVSVQSQVLALLKQLQQEEGMAMLLITHDLGLVRNMAHTVGLMYAGQLVEVAPAAQFFAAPAHPYAQALMRALPSAHKRGQPLQALDGQVPSLVKPPSGCRFASRCGHVQERCQNTLVPMLEHSPSTERNTISHEVRCWRHAENLLNTLVDGVAGVSASPDDVVNLHVKPVKFESNALDVKNLRVAYPQSGLFWRKSDAWVLKGLSFSLKPGQTVALVGESGSGKTTAARALLGLLPQGSQLDGEVLLSGQALWQQSSWRAQVQFVFQDPFASLSPRQRIAQVLEEPLVHLCPYLDAQARVARVQEVLFQVGLPLEALQRFPHEFSGGQRQRIAIARALVSRPKVLVCDEPTSALDVSVQAQILNLLTQLQRETGVAMLLITHNLAVVHHMADEVLVLCQGELVECGATEAVFEQPQHLYTRTLFADALLPF